MAVLDDKWIMKSGHMAWQTDYCIMKEGMPLLRGRKSVPGMNSSGREMERGYYSAFTECENLDTGTETNANLDNKLYYHFLGTFQYEDIFCWENPDNIQYTLKASVTKDGK
nr:prolyl endopeptidase-like isoform X2 [Tanacetum cinerariifolium]